MFGWWEVISLIANVGLLVWAVYERILSQRDKDYIKSSIRAWQHEAQGIATALRTLAWASGAGFSPAKFSHVKDVGIALDALHDVAESMSQSLYESRFFTDEELKENIQKDKAKAEEALTTITIPKTKRKKIQKEAMDVQKVIESVLP